jgi:probable rRNA maturation factor
MEIAISNRQRTKKVNVRWLQKITLALLSDLKLTDAELGIHLVGSREMARVNWQFLRHEGSTDVITFDHLAADSAPPTAKGRLHGELFICMDDAVAQATEFQTTWQSEVVRYGVHGVLHLLGHDDVRPGLRRKMKRQENRLLRRLEQRFSFADLARVARISA